MENFTVRQDPATGIPLTIEGTPVVTLRVKYGCAWDGPERYLRVNTSTFAVHYGAEAAGEPLFHYDYNRNEPAGLPRAHLQVHSVATSDIGSLIYVGGRGTHRGRRRQDDIDRKGFHPRQWDLRFPVGGDRFRPSLEDVLQLLVDELGVDARDGWKQALQEGRREWRDTQLRAAVRDNPRAAAETLADQFGYRVDPPEGGHPPDTPDQLTRL